MARIILVVVAFVGTVLAQSNPPLQTPCKSPVNPIWARLVGNIGTWWGNLTEDQKDMFMDGYFLAMDNASSTLHSLSDAQMKEIQPGDKEFNAKLYGVMNLRYTSDKFSFKLDKPLKPALDDFYKEPLNNRIPIQFGMEYMRDKLAGKKTEGQLVDELNEWRKIMNKSAGTN